VLLDASDMKDWDDAFGSLRGFTLTVFVFSLSLWMLEAGVVDAVLFVLVGDTATSSVGDSMEDSSSNIAKSFWSDDWATWDSVIDDVRLRFCSSDSDGCTCCCCTGRCCGT